MRRCHSCCRAVPVALLLIVAGCQERTYRSEVKLSADGSVERAICQPADDVPETALRNGVWKTVKTVADKTAQDLDVPIGQLAPKPNPEPHDYFAASGSFTSVDKLPEHFRRQLDDKIPGIPVGTLDRSYMRTDYTFVVEHRWRETLVENVTLDDMHAAWREVSDLMVELGEAVLKDALGEEFDTSGLRRWAETTGRAACGDLVDAMYELGLRHKLNDQLAVQAAVARVCKRYGLDLLDERGKPLADAALADVVQSFAQQVIRQGLKRRDGRPVDEATVARVVAWLRLPSAGKEPANAHELDPSIQKVVAARFGSEDAFWRRVAPLLVRVVGIYHIEFLGPPRKFHYTMDLPGLLVETNGKLLGDAKVRWTFEATDAYPAGYAMECRSLDPQLGVQQKLLGRRPLTSRADMLRYIEILAGDEPLRTAMRDCGKQGTLDALEKHWQSQLMQPASDARKRTEQLRKLLGLATGK